MHSLYGAQPVPHVPLRVTYSALVAHRCTYAPNHWRTYQNRATFIHLSVSLWNDLAVPVFDVVGLTGSKTRANPLLLSYAACSRLLSSTVVPFFYFFLYVGIVRLGSSD